MEGNKSINVALNDTRYKPEIIDNLECRFINDDPGMVINFIRVGSELFQIRQLYRAKEGWIIRVLQGTGRILINLIECEIPARKTIIIPDNSLVEMLGISFDYDFQVITPAYDSPPATPNFTLSEIYTGNGITLSLNEEGWTQTELSFILLWKVFYPSPYRRETVRHLIVFPLCNLKYVHK